MDNINNGMFVVNRERVFSNFYIGFRLFYSRFFRDKKYTNIVRTQELKDPTLENFLTEESGYLITIKVS